MMLLMKKEFLQFFRNAPLLLIVLYCCTYDIYGAGDVSMDVRNYPIAVYDLDRSLQSREFIQKFREPEFRITRMIQSENEVRDLIESGDISVILVFPEDFGRKLNSYRTAQIQVILDGSKSNTSQIALNYIGNIVYEHNIELLTTKWKVSKASGRAMPFIELNTRYMYNQNLDDKWVFCLQQFLQAITLIGILLTATAMVNEKQFGTIEQLMVAPLKTYEIMFAKVIPMIMILFVVTFISIFGVLIPLQGLPLVGSPWAFFFATVLYLFALSGLGLLISTLSNNLSETVLFSILILVPIMFLSGAFVSPEVLPAWVRALMHLSPLKYYMDITNGIFFKGNSLGSMWKLVAGLAAIGAGAFSLGAHRFRRAFQ
jgi:ABC-2 type transport system permease protein